MESLKARYFDSHPDEPVILHRSDIMNRRGAFLNLFVTLVSKMPLTEEILKRLREWEYVVITVCLDKERHVKRSGAWSRDPYHYCMEVLLGAFLHSDVPASLNRRCHGGEPRRQGGPQAEG